MKKSSRTIPNRLPRKLKHIREALKLSQNELLERMGFGNTLFRSNISQYEHGDRVPPLLVVLQYARVAGISMEEIVDDALNLPKRLNGAQKAPRK